MITALVTPSPTPKSATNKSTTLTTTKNPTMKHAPAETDKDHGKDTKKFAQLPAKTQELEVLHHEAEKSTGQARVALDKLIEEQSKQKDS